MSTDPRLPRHTVPRAYRIELTPDIAQHKFSGSVEIDVEITDRTDTVIINASELAIHTASIDAGSIRTNLNWEIDETNERLTLTHPDRFAMGFATLTISFTGLLNDQLRGFYRSSFTDEAGTEHTIATTQFQSTDARRCFPCWDEPEWKATFASTLTVDASHVAVSNTAPVEEATLSNGRRRVRFAPTMVMSTYLVAYVVGPLEITAPVEANGVAVRVVHQPGQGHLTSFALDVATHAVPWFHDYFDIAYPGDKIDLIAIPDFAAGAMENLGCITFRDVLLLVDPNEASQPELQRIADVINHELAHMWFGDLVTMRWWEGIWLNEAFATFMAVACSDAYRPDWRVWDSFARMRAAAFDVDALASTRPIEFPVITPDDADAMFDLLTYEKGASVVRMLEQYLGETMFRDGVRHYLKAHAYRNTETTDLWDSLEAVSQAPVRTLMHNWIFQGGHPLIQSRVTPHGVQISQRQFTLDPAMADDRTWDVPLAVRTDQDEARFLLRGPSLLHTGLAGSRVITVNGDSSGFMREMISAEQLGELERFGLGDRSATERQTLADDGWGLTVAGHLHAAEYLRLVVCFTGETDLNVWQALSTGLHGLDRLVTNEARPALAERVRLLAGPVLERRGLTPAAGEDDRSRELRATLIRLLGTVGHDEVIIASAADRLDHSSPEIAAAALTVASSNGGRVEFDRVRESWKTATDPQAQIRNLRALANFPEIGLIEELFATIDAGEIRSQDAPFVVARALTNVVAGARAWQYITTKWDSMLAAYPPSSIPRMLSGITALDTPDLVEQTRAFLGHHCLPSAGKQIDQHLERQQINADLRARERDRFSATLR